MLFFKNLNLKYNPGNLNNYRGRSSKLENEYWHQMIQKATIDQANTAKFGIIGYACDIGVKRNKGRIGAQQGPKAIRQQLGKLPVHFSNTTITDFGTITAIDNSLEDCQTGLSYAITKLIKNNTIPIALGGGHDMAYANFNGIKKALEHTNKTIGIINFDAHFDLRPLKTKANSGTPFYQILTENSQVNYLAIGIQQQANTKTLYAIADKNKVSYISNLECQTFTDTIKNKLNTFIKSVDVLYITIDLDGFSSAYAPGVSAPSSLGYTPHFAYAALQYILKSNNVISVDIAELNPKYDIDSSTAKLAAKLVDFIVCNTP